MTRIVRHAVASAAIAAFTALTFAPPVLAQQSPSPAPSGSAAPGSSGGGGSGMVIEQTILAYQGLQSDATGIATAVAGVVPQRSKIVVATPVDVAALLQLRIVLSQIGLLNDRMHELRMELYALPCKPPMPQASAKDVNAGALTPVLSLFSTPSDISTMVSTAASFSASTESISGQAGNFTDATLVSLVAESLNLSGKPITVYVPGVAPPNWGAMPPADSEKSVIESDREQSYLYQGIRALELNRSSLQREALSALNNPEKPQCKKDKDLATMIKRIDAAATAADKLASGLIGSPPPPPSSLLGEPAQSTSSAKQPGGNAKPPPGGPAQINQTVNVNPPASGSSSASGPPPLQQLLYIDLLLHQLSYRDRPNEAPHLYLVSVHALEAAGSQLTKTSTFLGTRLYYSGGAAASFTLIDSGGSMVCSGIAYGYRGFVKADDVALAVAPLVGTVNPAVAPGTQNTLPNGQRYTPRC
jgi:hypothetical protein